MPKSLLAGLGLVVLSLALAAAEGLEMGPSPAQGIYPGFDVRYAPGLDPALNPPKLLSSPTMTHSEVVLFEQAMTGEKRMEGLGVCEAIYDIPLAIFASVLDAQDGAAAWLPGTQVHRVESRKGREAILYQESGSSFLGVRVSFRNRILQVWDDLPGGAVGIRNRILESLDGKLFESCTSWYLSPIVVNGVERTYVRYFMRSGLRKPFPGADALLRAYMPTQLSGMMKAVAGEAKRRLGKG